MAAHAAWVLNLDADLELGAGEAYQPTRAVRQAMAPHVAALARTLPAPDDVVVTEATLPGACAGRIGRAFCPTPRALALLRRAGAEAERAPSLAVLRRVASRAFSSGLGPTLPDARFSHDLDEILATLARAPAIGRGWRVKRAHGMAGRLHRVIAPGSPSAADRAFLAASVAGGVQLEPEVEIVAEYGLHGWLDERGGLRVGQVVGQRCDPRGSWLETARIEAPPCAARLVAEAERVAEALHAAGYFGPFGIDAFTYRDRGTEQLQPRSEVNPRYSMGFPIGFGRP